MKNVETDLSFTALKIDEIDYVFIETTNGGPFVEDLFYEVVAGNQSWRVRGSEFPVSWLTALPDVNNETIIHAQLRADNGYFLVWAREPELVITPARKTNLTERMESLLSRIFVMQPEDSKKIAEDLVEQYSSSSRRYHGLRHIAQCLKELDSMRDDSIDRDSIELAIWYHDVVYVPGSGENEKMSAQKMVKDLSQFESKLSIEKVEQMICATNHDGSDTYDKETNILLDIDLSILGQRHQDYESYRYGVRQEFRGYSRLTFSHGRKNFLRNLLAGPIFHTQFMKQKYEKAAIKNIEGELIKLDSSQRFNFSNLRSLVLRVSNIHWISVGKVLGVFAVMTTFYATLSFVLEFRLRIPYILVVTGLFFLGKTLLEVFLKVAHKQESYKVQEGTELRTETLEDYLVVPLVLAVCIRIANYSALYSTLIIFGLFLFLFCFARIIADD